MIAHIRSYFINLVKEFCLKTLTYLCNIASSNIVAREIYFVFTIILLLYKLPIYSTAHVQVYKKRK